MKLNAALSSHSDHLRLCTGQPESSGPRTSPNTAAQTSKRPRKAAVHLWPLPTQRGQRELPVHSAGLYEDQLTHREENQLGKWDTGYSFLSQSLAHSYLKIAPSGDEHFAIWRKAEVGHPASVGSGSFFCGNRST